MTTKQKKLGLLVGAVLLVLIVFYVFSSRNSEVTEENPMFDLTAEPFLPNGTEFDSSILSDPRTEALIPPNYPIVTREELGVAEPFQ